MQSARFSLSRSRLALVAALAAASSLLSPRVRGFFAEGRNERVARRLHREQQNEVSSIARGSLGQDASPERVVAAAQQAFLRIHDGENEAHEKAGEPAPVATPFIGPSTAQGLVETAEGLHVEVSGPVPAHAASVSVAERGASLRVSAESAVSMQGEPEGADQGATPALAGGYLVYPNVFSAQPGVKLVRRVTGEGAEDYFVYPSRPAQEELTYRISLDDGVAGLRKVAGTSTLELLDGGGTPRLRVNPPEGMDKDGKVFPVSLAVLGCAVDESAALPFGRTPIAPGARTCELRLSWSAQAYPATVDPSFVATGSMSKGRFSHSSATVGTNKVLVWGASYSSGDATSEVYDFTTGTWTAAPNLPFTPVPGAGYHSQLHFPDGRPMALESGGSSRVAAYDPVAGTWSLVGSMTSPQSNQIGADTAVQLKNGDILTYSGSKFSASTSTWSAVPPVPSAGAGFFVAYGNSLAMWSNNGAAYSFNTATNAYTQLPNVPFATGYSGGVILTNGDVLVSGQYPSTGKCAIYSASTNAWRGCANQNTHQIIEAGVATLPTGVLYVGVDYGGTGAGKAESYDSTSNTWTVTPLSYASADFPAVTAMPDGRLLLSGGMTSQDSGVGFANASVLGCTSNAQCGSGSTCVINPGNTVGSCHAACTNDAQCGGSLPACDTTSGACVQCTATNSTQCTGATPVCNTTTKTCGSDTSTITITSPNGGEVWGTGSTQNITWTSSGTATVSIDLYKTGAFVAHIASAVSAATGSYTWSVPTTLANGSDYRVDVFNPRGSTSSFSAAPFTITSVLPTTTALSSSANPSSYGQSVTFTATLNPSGATGSVQFAVDNVAFGGPTSVSGGTARSPATAALGAGSHSVSATFTGSGSYQSSSATLTQTVNQGASSVALQNSPASPVVGQPVTLTATVTGAGATPTGQVSFYDGTTLLATVNLVNGVATFDVSSLGPGPHSLTASYAGDANDLPAQSATDVVTVSPASTTTALAAAPQDAAFGSAVTLTATVSVSTPGGGTADGMVTFSDGGSTLGSAALSGGVAQLVVSTLAVGPHTLSASYGGSASFDGSSGSTGENIVRGAAAISLASGPANPVYGQTVTFVVSLSGSGATPTGAVTLFDGVSALATATLSNGTVTIPVSTLAAGPHSITAQYAGDGNFNPATSDPSNVTVGKASTSTSLSASPQSASYGAQVTLTATVRTLTPGAGTATGTVTFTDGRTTLGTAALSGGVATLNVTTLSVGSHSLTASSSGDANFNGSFSTPFDETINQAQTTVALSAAPGSSVWGQSVTLTASVTGAGAPTGTVTFLDGAQTLGTGAISNGAASLSLTSLAVGLHQLSASYGGDSNFVAATSSTASFQVSKAQTQVALSAQPGPTFVDRPVTLQAVVSPVAPGAGTPAGTVTFTDGTTTLGTSTLDGTGAGSLTVSSLQLGNHPLAASYGGSTDFQPSKGSVSTGLVIQKSAPVAGSGFALSFDGATQTATAANTDGALDAVQSVELMFERAASESSGSVACLLQQGSGASTVFGLCLTAARDGLVVRRGSDTQQIPVDLGPGWHNLALTGGSTTTLYVDGVKVASLAGGLGTGTRQPLVFAGSPAGQSAAERFGGKLDEVRLFSSPRAAGDLAGDLERPVSTTLSSLLALWRLDEGSGASLYDAGPAHEVASLEGAPAWVSSDAWKKRATSEERPLAPFTGGYDPDRVPITITVVTPPAHGAVTAQADQVSYVPTQAFIGKDSFTYEVSNGQGAARFTTDVTVTHIEVCAAQSDCAGGDVCSNSRCEAPANLSSGSGGCSSLPSQGGSAALLPLGALGVFLLLRSRRRRLGAMGATLVVAVCAAPQARAHGFALDTFEPSPVGDHFFEIPDASVDNHQAPSFGFEAAWAHRPLSLYSSGAVIPNGRLVRDQVGMRLGGSLALFDRVLLDADISMSAWQQGETPFNGLASVSTTAFRDPRLGARVSLVDGEPLSVAVGLSVFVPFGSQSGYGSDSYMRALPQVLASGRAGSFIYAGEAGVELRRHQVVDYTAVGSAMRLGLAAGALFLQDKLQVGPEVFSRVQFGDASASSLEGLFGARYQAGNFNLGAGVGARLDQRAPGAAPLRALLQVSFNGFDFLRSRSRGPARTGTLAAAGPSEKPLAQSRPADAPVAASNPAAASSPAPQPPGGSSLAAGTPPPSERAARPATAAAPAPSASQSPIAAGGQQVKLERNKVDLERALRFQNHSAVLDQASQKELHDLAAALLAHSGSQQVFITGHSDSRGSATLNTKLASRRAAAVRVSLIGDGVPASKVEARGCGSGSPVASNETPEGRFQNRRVEIRLAGEGEVLRCTP